MYQTLDMINAYFFLVRPVWNPPPTAFLERTHVREGSVDTRELYSLRGPWRRILILGCLLLSWSAGTFGLMLFNITRSGFWCWKFALSRLYSQSFVYCRFEMRLPKLWSRVKRLLINDCVPLWAINSTDCTFLWFKSSLLCKGNLSFVRTYSSWPLCLFEEAYFQTSIQEPLSQTQMACFCSRYCFILELYSNGFLTLLSIFISCCRLRSEPTNKSVKVFGARIVQSHAWLNDTKVPQ